MSKKLTCLLLLVFLASYTFAEEQGEYSIIKNLKWDWVQFDKIAKQNVPYLKQSKAKTISFDLDLNKNQKFIFKIDLPQNYFMWVEDQLVLFTTEDKKYELSIDSLFSNYKKNSISVSIFSKKFNADLVQCQIVSKVLDITRSDSSFKVSERENRYEMNIFIIATIFGLVGIVIFRSSNHRLFKEYFSLRKALQIRQNFELITAYGTFSWVTFWVLFLYALLIGVTITNLILFLPDGLSIPLVERNSHPIVEGVKIGFLALLFISLKIPFLSVITRLFQLNKIKQSHFSAYFRQSLLLTVFVFLVSIWNGFYAGAVFEYGIILFQILGITLLIGRALLLFLILNRIHGYRKLHLFAYLCSTELIPLILFFKIFLK